MDTKETSAFEPCRFCGGLTDMLVPICLGEGVELELESKIARHLPIHVSADDGLPQGVCYPCVDLLQTWDSFVTSCVDMDARLRAITEVSSDCKLQVLDLNDTAFSESDDEPLLAKKQKLNEELPDVKENKETGLPYACDSCGRQFKGKKGLGVHARGCKNKEPLECDACGLMYKCRATLNRHKAREHYTDQAECPVCQQSVSSRKLGQHLKAVHSVKRVDDGEPRFKCKLCEERFKSKYSRNDHMKEVHLNETIKCTSCDFEGLRHVVKRHSRTTHAEKRYPCNLCTYAFKTLHLLKTHMAAHSDLRCYTCDICGMGFKRLNNVRDHMKSHEKKTNQCQICGNFFARKRYLAIHEKTIHDFYADGKAPEEKGFECGTCGAKLKWKKNLMAHMRIHTGEKPYGCKICNIGFVCHGSLRTHMMKHNLATEGVEVLIAREGDQPALFSIDRVISHFNPSSLHLHQ